jgi:FtsH-binding integral membrane protein
MSYADNPYRSPMDVIAASAAEDERVGFITKTYLHLAGAIGAFVALEAVLLNLPGTGEMVQQVLSVRFGWIALMAGFMLVSYVADRWARTATSPAMQYAGLGLYVAAEAVIFVPLLWMADNFYPGVIMSAAIATLSLFGLLTVVVFITRKDFSFLRSALIFGGFAALGLIVMGAVFQFSLGPIFTYAMIALACGYILYDTSNILHHYRIGQHVAASLALFASVALLFWYLVQLFMSRRD